MPRGRTGPVVSLFAFQDIITAVSGILIVIVLLLALELVEQPEETASSSTAQAERVDSALQAAAAELQSLKAELQTQGEQVREAAGSSADSLQEALQDLAFEKQRVETELQKLQAEAEVLSERQTELEVKQFDAAADREELAAERKHLEDLQAEIGSEESDERVVYTLPKGLRKSGWLVVIGDEIRSAPIGREEKPRNHGRDPDRFLNWAAAQPEAYFLLLVRPSGIERFGRIYEDFNEAGISYGFDVTGDETPLLHPERGAAP